MANYVVTKPAFRQMSRSLRRSIAQRGSFASWLPSSDASMLEFDGILSAVSTSQRGGPGGIEDDVSALLVASRTDFDEAQDFPSHGSLMVEGHTFRVSRIRISEIALTFELGEPGL